MTGERNKSLGQYGEGLAARRLVEAGMTVIDRNWRCDAGELDLVLRDGRVEQVGTPGELYDRPNSTFVAGFIGSPKMNFLTSSADGRAPVTSSP